MPDRATLRQFQALPLTAKITMSKNRIYAWYEHFDGKVCVSFSGGKDSTVLAHLVHSIFPEVPLVFANTGLEYPEIQAFARKMGAEFVRPKMSFSEVISTYGYPIISKENAEAIYYARRIKNGGVLGDRPQKRPDTREICSTVRHMDERHGNGYKRRQFMEIGGVSQDRSVTNSGANGMTATGSVNEAGVRPNQTSSRRNLLTGGNGNLREQKDQPG